MKVEFVVSACLCGCKCRYDGKDNLNPYVKKLVDEGRAIPVCPEVMGGLSTPRLPSEIIDGLVINSVGFDNTPFYLKGALESMKIVEEHNIKKAILKAKSPSCGARFIYDGTFTRTLIPGSGVFAKMLIDKGVLIYEEGDDLSEL